MSFALVQQQKSSDTNDGGANSVATQTFGSSFTAGNCIAGYVSWSPGDATISSIDDNLGNTYTIDQTVGVDSNGIKSATFHLENILGGASPVITAHFAGASNTFRRIHAEEWSGIATASALDKKNAQFSNGGFGTGTDACTSGTQVTDVDGCLIWGIAYDSASTTLSSVGTSFTITDSATFGAGDNYVTEQRTQASQGSVAATFTSTAGGTDFIHVHMLAFKPAGGGVTASITGTATSGATEADIVAGGKTVIATVSGDTFVASSSTPGIALRGTPKANNAANGGNVVLTWDTGNNAPQTGDWVVIFGGHGNAVTTLLPPGVNAVNDGTFTNIAAHTGSAPVVGAWKKKMGATPDLKATCSGAGSASDGVAYIGYVFKNVDPTTSEDASATFNNATSTNPNPHNITTVTNGAVVLALAGSRVNDTTPGNVANYVNQISSSGNDTNPMSVSGLIRTIATAGLEDPAAFSSWSSGVWNAFTIALRPQVDTPFNNIRQNIINGMVGDSTDAHGWNNEVQTKLAVNAVVRTNSTVVTITLNAAAAYNITTNETVTVTVPNNALASGNSLVGTPTFVISAAGGGGSSIKYTQLEHAIRGAFRGIILGARH